MKTSKILFSGLGLGGFAATGTGGYFLIQKISQKSIKFSGKLVFLKKLKEQEKDKYIYVGNLSFDEEYLEKNNICKIEASSVSCDFSNLKNKNEAVLLLKKLEEHTSFNSLKEKLLTIKDEFEDVFGENFYHSLKGIFDTWSEQNFEGWLVCSIDKKNGLNPEKFVCKLSLVDDSESSDKKIFLKLENPIDKKKASEYLKTINLDEISKEDVSELKKKLKEYLEKSENKTAFEAAFSEEIYKNLIKILDNNS